jgi:ATP/maltotriose-dependent transcriptional regulator MalT
LNASAPILTGQGDVLNAITFLSLYVVALRLAGMSARSHAILARLLEVTAPARAMRVYLHAGTPMKEALQSFLSELREKRHPAPAVSRSYIATLLRAFDQEAQRGTSGAQASSLSPQRASCGSTLAPGQAASSLASVPRAPLTAQEQRVLRLLSAGLSNQEIAQTLVVSLNTVKTHLKHLYHKLKVRSRSQAGALARDLHIRASHSGDLTPQNHSEG